ARSAAVCRAAVRLGSHSCLRTAPAACRLCPLSLHDALPISLRLPGLDAAGGTASLPGTAGACGQSPRESHARTGRKRRRCPGERSEEHTSELQSHLKLVCRLLLQKKKRQTAQRSCTPVPGAS